MQIIVEKAPASSPVKPGDILTSRQGVELMQWRGRRHIRRALAAGRFKSHDNRYVFRCRPKPDPASVEAMTAELAAEMRRLWLKEKADRGDPITIRVLHDMGFPKHEIATVLRQGR